MHRDRNPLRLCVVVACALFLASCGNWRSSVAEIVENCRTIPAFNPDMASADAKEAASIGDNELLAVYGYTVEIPGVRGDDLVIKSRNGYFMIGGTGDHTRNPSCRSRNERARNYALIYNKTIVGLKLPK